MSNIDTRWIHRTSDALDDAVTRALARKREDLDAIIAIPASERTFLNTIGALEHAGNELADMQQQLDLLLGVHPDAAVREAAQTAIHRIEEANIGMEYDRRLWVAVEQWLAHSEHLEGSDKKLADDTVRDMRRMGFALNDADFGTLKKNVAELKKLETQFETAINDWDDAIVVTKEQLAGLPQRYIDGLTKEGERYRVSLEYPDLFPFMRLAEDDDARRELATKNLLKGGRPNLERLARMIELRQKNAQLLGYATHADFVAEPRMVKTAHTARTFIEGILRKLIPAARRELVALIDLKKEKLNSPRRIPIHFHEMAYWSHKHLREHYHVDDEQVKEYFPLQHVVASMLAMYQEVLGVQFHRVEGATLWHEDAQLYEVVDGATSYGHFVFDLYPRRGKYGHAAAFPVTLGRVERDGTRVTGMIALVCNFPQHTAERPSLLSHDEVETLLHEFGHVMHALLSTGTWQRQNGFGVPLDFVEALSQLFEEWAWDTRVLARLSSHVVSGAFMPEEMQKALIASRRHMVANFYVQQATKALYDLKIHSQPTDALVDVQALADDYRKLQLECEAIEIPESSLFPAGWGHMSDYDAGYYGYLWSKVYALDMYTAFLDDPLDASVGLRYRREVLQPGASHDALALVKSFLQRGPSDTSFLEALGIKE